ncbi:MAG: lipopolysaccharide kinase InaA family protein [Planctomycetota bacterium]|jgi:tRNA A-37 threonylcarbamoyl transferase component Bud32
MGEPDYTVLYASSGTAYGVPDLTQAELSLLLDDPAAALWRNLHRPVKISYASLMVEAELTLLGGTAHVAYKQYRPRNWWKSLCGLFRRGRAQCAWHLGHRLLARGIRTARPVAMCRPRGSWLFRTSYLATEWIEGAENLHLFFWRLASRELDLRLRAAARCAESLGRLVGRMHALQIAHRDLKGANLLVAQRGHGLTTYLIDVDGVRFRRRLSRARRAANLARLAAGIEAHPWVTRSVCCRFLRAYVGQFPSGAIGWKPLWREVAARSRRIVQRKRRGGEPVL